MPGMSWGELMVIAIVALVVIGPKDLPRVMRTLGQWMRKLRGMAAEFQGAVNEMVRQEEIEEIRKQIAALRDPELEAQLEQTMAQAQERVRPTAPISAESWAAAPDPATDEDEFLSSDLEDIQFERADPVTPDSYAAELESERARPAPKPIAEALGGGAAGPGDEQGPEAGERAGPAPETETVGPASGAGGGA